MTSLVLLCRSVELVDPEPCCPATIPNGDHRRRQLSAARCLLSNVGLPRQGASVAQSSLRTSEKCIHLATAFQTQMEVRSNTHQSAGKIIAILLVEIIL